MLEDLDNADEIVGAAERLLADAGAHEHLPTPVDELVAAAGLMRGDDADLFSDATLAQAPPDLRDKIRGLRGKLFAALDRRERVVFVNPEIQRGGRRNFQTLHEVGHDILPSQADLAYADDYLTLSPATRKKFEQQANQTAAELLFQRNFYERMASDYALGMAAVVETSQRIGASIHAGLRRYVETHHRPVAAVVLARSPVSVVPMTFRRSEACSSSAWRERFPRPDTEWSALMTGTAFPFLCDVPRLAAEEIVQTTCPLADRAGAVTTVTVEIFSNTYNILALLWPPQRQVLRRRRRLERRA